MRVAQTTYVAFLLCRGWIFVAALNGQTSGNVGEVTTRETPIAFQAGVNLVPVTVVVRDSRGKAIGNLGRDDFKLSDNGKAQMISRFTVETLGGDEPQSVPAAQRSNSGQTTGKLKAAESDGIPDRFIAYLFDDQHLSTAELNYTRDAARRRIDSSGNPLQRIAIFASSGEPLQEFTGDHDKLHAALDALSASRATAQHSLSTCPAMTYYMGDQIYNKNDKFALNIAAADAVVCADLYGNHPGAEEYDTAMRMATAAARDSVLLGDKDTESVLDALRNVVSRMASMPGQRTIVLISPGFLVRDDRLQEQTALIERAIKANVVISALDARGIYTLTPGGDVGQIDLNKNTVTGRAVLAKAEAEAQSDAMELLTSGTGGTFYEGRNDYDEGLARTAATPEYIYVLGFSPLELKMDGRYHNLKVTLAGGLNTVTVQARKGYYAPAHATDPAEQAKQLIEETFFSRDQIHDLPAVLQTQYFKSDNGDVRLSATAEVDVKKLAYRRDGDRNRNDITVVTGVFDNDGNYVTGAQKIVEMRLLDETLAKRLNSGIGVKSSFAVHPGRYVVRMVVRDSEGQLMSAQSNVIEIP